MANNFKLLKTEEKDNNILLGEHKQVEVSDRQFVIYIKTFQNVCIF